MKRFLISIDSFLSTNQRHLHLWKCVFREETWQKTGCAIFEGCLRFEEEMKNIFGMNPRALWYKSEIVFGSRSVLVCEPLAMEDS